MVTVHNAHSPTFVEYFEKLSENDLVYRNRFFAVNEMRYLLLKVCRTLEIVPVGKGEKHYEDEMINQGHTTRFDLRAFFDGAKMDNLETSERLLCVGYL